MVCFLVVKELSFLVLFYFVTISYQARHHLLWNPCVSENIEVITIKSFCSSQRKKATIVKPVLVATSIKQATCIKQAFIHFPKRRVHSNVLVISKHLS